MQSKTRYCYNHHVVLKITDQLQLSSRAASQSYSGMEVARKCPQIILPDCSNYSAFLGEKNIPVLLTDSSIFRTPVSSIYPLVSSDLAPPNRGRAKQGVCAAYNIQFHNMLCTDSGPHAHYGSWKLRQLVKSKWGLDCFFFTCGLKLSLSRMKI